MICKNCNSVVADTAKFCASCGTPVEQPTAPAAPVAQAAVCRSCGNPLAAGIKFCAVCGTAVEAPAAFQPAVPAPPVAPAAPMPVEVTQPFAAPAAPAPVEAFQPVNDVVPQPVQTVAPASEIPQPVREAAPIGAVPQPVNDVMPEPANASAPVVGMANGFGQAPVAPAYTAPQSMGVDMDIAGIDMDAASVTAVKPVKKSKVGLWIGLGAAGVVAAAAAVGGLCFRGVIANLFMGDNKYAASIEGKVFEAVTEINTEDLEKTEDFISEYFSTVLTVANSTAGSNGSSADTASALAGIDLEDIISTYNVLFVETYGADGITMNLDADLQLTDTALSEMGADSEIIDIINGSKLTMAYQAGEDALGAEVVLTDPDGFEISGRGVVTKDGTVAVMLPFATDKCIKMTLDTDGNVSSVEEVTFDLDAAELHRISEELINIYLKHFELAEVTVQKGSMKAAKVEASGRIIIAELDEDLLGDMVGEMITFMAEDEYFIEKFGEFMELTGEEFSESDLKEDLESDLEDIKDDITCTLTVTTMVDNNSNLLAKGYSIEGDEDDFGIVIVGGEAEQGFEMIIDEMEVLTVKAVQESETNGTVDIVIEDVNTEINVAVKYEDVQTVPYLNTETVVGKYDIEIEAEDETINLAVETSVDGSTMKVAYTVEAKELGTVSLAMDMTPEALNLTDIPAGAVDFSNADSWTEDEAKANAQYMLDALNEIKAKCDANTSSTFAGLIAPLTESGITYFDDLLTPMASYEAITTLSDGISEIMVQLSSTYDANYEYVSDATYNECSDLYDELDELYDDVAYEYEMKLETYNEYSARASALKEKASELCEKIVEEAETAREQASAQNGFAGMWQAAEIIQGSEVSSPDDWGFSSSIYIFEDGSYYWDWNGTTTYGEWESEGDVLYFYEDDVMQEFVLSGNILSYEADGGIVINYGKSN